MTIHYRNFPDVTDKIKATFWSRVHIIETDQCWIWQGGTIPERGNYGRFYIYRKDFRAHRVAYWLHYRIDPGTKDVCHKCDNPPCCNPYHLFCGTRMDNHKDMDKKGRRVVAMRLHPERAFKGEQLPQAKFRNADILSMRQLAKDGMSQSAISRMFSTNKSNVWKIIHRNSWKHI